MKLCKSLLTVHEPLEHIIAPSHYTLPMAIAHLLVECFIVTKTLPVFRPIFVMNGEQVVL